MGNIIFIIIICLIVIIDIIFIIKSKKANKTCCGCEKYSNCMTSVSDDSPCEAADRNETT